MEFRVRKPGSSGLGSLTGCVRSAVAESKSGGPYQLNRLGIVDEVRSGGFFHLTISSHLRLHTI